MALATILISSSVVSALVAGLITYLSQRSLAARQAHISYEFEARKRLYAAVGPLRFQLLLAARDVVRRVRSHDLDGPWDLRTDRHYGRTLLYRILRPLALLSLIERQMSYADFSVDATYIDILRFDSCAYRMFTGSDPLPYYEEHDWEHEVHHVLRDNLRAAADRLISVDAAGKEFVLDYPAFARQLPQPREDQALQTFARLIDAHPDKVASSAAFWVRLVGFAYACSHLIQSQGRALGFTTRELDVQRLIGAVDDVEILEHVTDYPGLFDEIMREGL